MAYYLLLKEFDAKFFSPDQDDSGKHTTAENRQRQGPMRGFFAALRMTTR
jgi:hypothetical protein